MGETSKIARNSTQIPSMGIVWVPRGVPENPIDLSRIWRSLAQVLRGDSFLRFAKLLKNKSLKVDPKNPPFWLSLFQIHLHSTFFLGQIAGTKGHLFWFWGYIFWAAVFEYSHAIHLEDDY